MTQNNFFSTDSFLKGFISQNLLIIIKRGIKFLVFNYLRKLSRQF